MSNKNLDKMTKAQRVEFFAKAPRATAGRIHQLRDGEFVRHWVGKLRGRIVSDPDTGEYRHRSREAALDCARRFRKHAAAEHAKLGEGQA